jgi:excisionase family DNA binding protein
MATTSHPSADDPVLVSEAARLLNKSIATVRKWEACGRLRASRTAGGVRVFSRADVERLRDSLDQSQDAIAPTPAA